MLALLIFGLASAAAVEHWQVASKLITSDDSQCFELGVNGISNSRFCGGCRADAVCVSGYDGPKYQGGNAIPDGATTYSCVTLPAQCRFALVEDRPSPGRGPAPPTRPTPAPTPEPTTPAPAPPSCDAPRSVLRPSRSCRRRELAYTAFNGRCLRVRRSLYHCQAATPSYVFALPTDCAACLRAAAAAAGPSASKEPEAGCSDAAVDRAYVRGCAAKRAYRWSVRGKTCVKFISYGCSAAELGRPVSRNTFTSEAACTAACLP